jgi:hypothetical protein
MGGGIICMIGNIPCTIQEAAANDINNITPQQIRNLFKSYIDFFAPNLEANIEYNINYYNSTHTTTLATTLVAQLTNYFNTPGNPGKILQQLQKKLSQDKYDAIFIA